MREALSSKAGAARLFMMCVLTRAVADHKSEEGRRRRGGVFSVAEEISRQKKRSLARPRLRASVGLRTCNGCTIALGEW